VTVFFLEGFFDMTLMRRLANVPMSCPLP